MKRIIILAASIILCCNLFAQTDSLSTKKKNKIFFAYDVGVMTTLDNREYDWTDLDASRTIFGLGIGGGVGAGLRVGNSSHRLMAGVSALFEFGGDIKAKPLIWYQLNTHLKNSAFQILGGCFSRSNVKGFYSQLLFSDANIIYDNSYEGFQFSWKARNFYYELGIDWKGQLRSGSPDTREQFTIYTAGRHTIIPGHSFRVGYAGYMHHYANNYAGTANNVVDDIIFYPYVENDFGPSVNVQRILARLGYYQAIQRDRAISDNFLLPAKGQVYLELRHWNVGIVNDFLFGGDLMPYYGKTGPDGKVYDQTTLYSGDPIMARNANGKEFALYDKVGIYYEPKILEGLYLRLQINCHFNDGFAGWQQIIELKYKFGN